MEAFVSRVLDQVDIHILDVLQKDATISNAELARRVSLSPPRRIPG